MTEQSKPQYPKDTEQNTGARMAEVDSDPKRSLKETKNAAAGEAPNGAGGSVPNTVEDHVPSTSDPEATDLPTAR
ncbi:MAG TPA: hypothetical protein V6C65_13140 [Allocoleopsis sp.]